MDDAVSLEKTAFGYHLGVHIADVAAYITPDSDLDAEAFSRGTSIYLPHQTVPMLPQILSNNLCSLNPNADRLAVSVMIDLDPNAQVLNYSLSKSTIHSLLKGSYSEVNQVLTGETNARITDKYAAVTSALEQMQALAQKLRDTRIHNGANVSNDEDNKIIVNGWSVDIVHRQKGEAEHIIEEFMVLANRLVAEYFLKNDLAVVYRAQTEKNTVAVYTTEQCHHAELALDHYAHFTSPIRRLADLKIHQVLTAHLDGMDTTAIHALFDEPLAEAVERAKKRKGTADGIAKACNNFCIKMWAEMQPDELFPAQMVGRDAQNRAIIEILPFHIRALGAASLRACEGEMLSCKLLTNSNNNKLSAVAVKRQLTTAAA